MTEPKQMGRENNFPDFLQDGVRYCPYGHAYYPTSPEPSPRNRVCAACGRDGFVDREGRQTQAGRWRKELLRREAS